MRFIALKLIAHNMQSERLRIDYLRVTRCTYTTLGGRKSQRQQSIVSINAMGHFAAVCSVYRENGIQVVRSARLYCAIVAVVVFTKLRDFGIHNVQVYIHLISG